MTKQIGAVALLVGALAAPAQAELKYTVRIEARPSTVAASTSEPSHPVIAGLMAAALDTIAPAGGLELTVTAGERGTRVDYPKPYLMVPAGGATIMLPDGSLIVIDPVAKTYRRMAKPASSNEGPPAPSIAVTRTGEFSTIAGVRAERATVEIRVRLPLAAVAEPPGMPAEMMLTGEIWITDQYREYARLAQVGMGGGFQFDALASEGFVVRSIIRGESLGGKEVESVVTSLIESTAPASLFEPPPGFTEAQ